MAVSSMKPNGAAPILEVRDLVKHFPLRRGMLASLAGDTQSVHAVNGISFTVPRGGSLGLAGESGCGKSTTAKMLIKLFEPTSGTIKFDGDELATLKGDELKAFRRKAQLMFQNPYESFSPRFTIFRSVVEPLLIHGVKDADDRTRRVWQALNDVQLKPAESFFQMFPHQLSGGQLQRVVLARALVLEPEFLAADEPVSMLDVSVRAGILNTMKEQAKLRNLTTVYISHDLSLIQYLCEMTAIMYLGQIVELGRTADVIEEPQHPYTKALISTIPIPDPERTRTTIPIEGAVPSAIKLPSGCTFHPRCPYAMDICKQKEPPPIDVGSGRTVRCFLYGGKDAENVKNKAVA